jgi:hypothetical protein
LNNRLYIGVASVCKFGRRYHPETGAKADYSTEEDIGQKTFEELRIIPQDLWDQVQTEIATRTRRAVRSIFCAACWSATAAVHPILKWVGNAFSVARPERVPATTRSRAARTGSKRVPLIRCAPSFAMRI